MSNIDGSTVKSRLKAMRGQLGDNWKRRALAQSMVAPAQSLLGVSRLTPKQIVTGRRILRWGERLLGRAQLDGSTITDIVMVPGLDTVDFPALLRALQTHLGPAAR